MLLRVLLSLLSPGAPASRADTADLPLRSAIMAAEDRRPPSDADLAPILTGLTSADSVARRLAARALGRLERSGSIGRLTPLLDDRAASVRMEAANALGQSTLRSGADSALGLLRGRLSGETNPAVRGVLFRTLGRLPVTRDRLDPVEAILLHGWAGEDSPEVLEGATHGLGAFYRRTAPTHQASDDAVERLWELSRPEQSVTVRRQAVAALIATDRASTEVLHDLLRDPDWQIRRLILGAARTQPRLEGPERLVDRAWHDEHPAVRYEGIRAAARGGWRREECLRLMPLLHDPDPHVRLLAIESFAGCGPTAAAPLRIRAARPFGPDNWHEPARALVALARLAREEADFLLPRFSASPVWWARMYAARAATASGNVAALERLAADSHPNVADAALQGLDSLRGHAADPFFIRALGSTDYQLLMTAAQALDGTPDAEAAVPPLLGTLERLTLERRETSRDPRLAVLATLSRIAGPARAPALRPYLTDFDPVVTERAAAMLSLWTGEAVQAAPRPLEPRPVPNWRELERLAGLRPVLVMQGGGRVVLRLFPFEAPTNVERFVRLARAGWFDGLTFHRVVPGYVVQGGSPGANEYAGDGPYTRDELGLRSHRRGTVGLSTRGRDTGDGQIFINLVDNQRLDHDYTVFAEVIEGMEVVDAIVEGAAIERVEIPASR